MTETELLALGAQIAVDPTCHGFLIGEPPRPLTNQEMYAFVIWAREQAQLQKDEKTDNHLGRERC